VYFKNAGSYGRRIDHLLTVYLAFDTNELVGCQVTGVRRLLNKVGAFGWRLARDKVDLGMFFYLLASRSIESESKQRYLEVGEAARGIELDLGRLQAA
jgi:hypothetical protein